MKNRQKRKKDSKTRIYTQTDRYLKERKANEIKEKHTDTYI